MTPFHFYKTTKHCISLKNVSLARDFPAVVLSFTVFIVTGALCPAWKRIPHEAYLIETDIVIK